MYNANKRWAWEYKNVEALAILAAHGIDLHFTEKDSSGSTPKDLCPQAEVCDQNVFFFSFFLRFFVFFLCCDFAKRKNYQK